MARIPAVSTIADLLRLIRWHKPSGRLILLIPAGWALWLNPSAPPPPALVALMLVGGLAVSAAGCVANDLWDRRIDPLVERTRDRPLAAGRVNVPAAVALLVGCLLVALATVLLIPHPRRDQVLALALAALPPVLLYASAKRWFALPQLVLALCWGFAVLIPWAAGSGSLSGGWPLRLTWLATVVWTFGFDTVYAMSDREDDRALGVRSSALTLGPRAPEVVAACYGITCLALAGAAQLRGIAVAAFWVPWLVATAGMLREAALLRRPDLPRSFYGRHFARQVWLGGLLLWATILPPRP